MFHAALHLMLVAAQPQIMFTTSLKGCASPLPRGAPAGRISHLLHSRCKLAGGSARTRGGEPGKALGEDPTFTLIVDRSGIASGSAAPEQ